MPVLSEDSVLIMDGAVKLYRRERSRKWQAAFQIDGQYIRISTGKSDLDEAKQAASDSYLEYKFRQKNGVPVVSKRFSDVAKLCITGMNKQRESGAASCATLMHYYQQKCAETAILYVSDSLSVPTDVSKYVSK